MDAKELTLLEDKARAIVSTLSSLESEVERQREMGDSLEQARDAILKLASEVSDVTEKLADALDLIKRSSLADVADRIGKTESTSAELLQRIEALESVIGRIDRNTQKGFGKEHG